MMFLNIVTPCSRPENLHTISKSINIPADLYKWWVVFDAHDLPDRTLIPNNCEPLLHAGGKAGHAQRNYALDRIHAGHVYMNDDDTVMHAQLWQHIQHLHHDFISFKQNDVHGKLRLMGDKLKLGGMDSHNFIVSRDLIGNTRWGHAYTADGRFVCDMHGKMQANAAFTACYIPEVLSVYNALR
jgi:hypothetical protein